MYPGEGQERRLHPVPCFGVISISGSRHCVSFVFCAGPRLSHSVHVLDYGSMLPGVFPLYAEACAVNIRASAGVFGQVLHL